ncbi:MAG: hypothetical protein KGI29_03170 [Pseudomonadota bacterium]|nr:hypothetical protein [Pseudomonadota bacterium]MDE3037459.1 hypothetical protein [Pseudomonadota bacterium]
MNSIGNITPLIQPVVTAAPASASAPAAQAALVASSAAAAGDVVDQVDVNSAQAVRQALQPKTPIANPEILGTGTFSLFTVGNVLYTRQTERNTDGSVKVTYVPQYPTLSQGSTTGSGLDIQA